MFPTIQELADHLNIRGPSVHEQIKKLRTKGVLAQSNNKARSVRLILDSAVISTQSAQPLDSPEKPEKSLITNKVTSIFSSSPDKPICCTAYALPTAVSRLIPPQTPTDVSRPERFGSVLSVQAATTASAPCPIPLYGSTVPAGFPSPADDYIEGHLDLNQHLIDHPTATFFVRVEGSSMTGAGIHHGNILVVDRSLEAKNGDIVVAVVYGELTVKRLQRANQKVWLIPENPQYTPLEITEEMEVTIWGVVTSAVHQFRR
ncbi:MAG: translesion error-prone DNA polymerase V autoproteolytic subunit [Magnetococcales bacterium]|nr:translesion error-prone DNA polymerase V autoproteolytic subunit [Magnetococcales bacterium]